jgi:MATE family multidrug resistance protein
MVGQVSQMLMGVIDSAMIGHAGTVPLAASAFGNNIFSIFYIFGIGLMLPVSIFVARSRGARQPAEAAQYLRHGLALAVVFGLLEMLAMFALGTQLHRFGQPPEVLAIVKPFYLLFAASITPVFVYLVLRQFAEAMGHPWVPMFLMLASVGLNALLNWIFIYGNLGAPVLGLTGAGISTLISRTVGALAIFLWLGRFPAVRAAWPRWAAQPGAVAPGEAGPETPAEMPPAGAGPARPTERRGWFAPLSRERLGEMFRVGLPASGMLLFESSAFAFSGIMVGWLGAVPLASHQIAMTCASLAFMFPLGLSIAAGMRVSHAVGADERARLRPIAFGAIALGVVVMTVFAVAFGAGGRLIASWFVPDATVIALASRLLVVAAVFQLADGVQVIAAAALRGITDVKVPAAITLVAYWGIALPLGYALGIAGPWGAPGVWTGIAGGLAFAAMFLTVRYARLTRESALGEKPFSP